MKTFNTLILLCLSLFSCESVMGQTVTTITDEFDASGGVKIGPDGHLYIGNFGQGLTNANGTQVWRLNLETLELEVFATGLQGASGNDFDSQGNLFQSNIAGGYISKINPNGQVSTFVSEGISAPVGIAIDEADNLYICNCGGAFAHTIRKVTPAGVSTQLAGGNLFSCPNGITIDGAGNLYVSNFNDSRVIKVTPEGQASVFAFIPGGNNGHLTYFEPFNVLFVNSHGTHSIYKVGLDDQIVVRIAGTGGRGNVDGPANQATFSRPNGIAASVTGDTLYLNSSIPTQDDPGNNLFPLNPSVIRMVTGIRDICTPTSSQASTPRWEAGIFPNPSQGELEVSLRLEEADDIQLAVLDTAGKQVQAIDWGKLPAGLHQRQLQLEGLPAGQYFLMASGNRYAQSLPFQLSR